jgi:hypothetical protein
MAFAWWSTRDSRDLGGRLARALIRASEWETRARSASTARVTEAEIAIKMLNGRDRELVALRRYIEGFDELLSSGKFNDMALARLRYELAGATTPQDDSD